MHRAGQKSNSPILYITLSNTGRFLKFFHYHVSRKLCVDYWQLLFWPTLYVWLKSWMLQLLFQVTHNTDCIGWAVWNIMLEPDRCDSVTEFAFSCHHPFVQHFICHTTALLVFLPVICRHGFNILKFVCKQSQTINLIILSLEISFYSTIIWLIVIIILSSVGFRTILKLKIIGGLLQLTTQLSQHHTSHYMLLPPSLWFLSLY